MKDAVEVPELRNYNLNVVPVPDTIFPEITFHTILGNPARHELRHLDVVLAYGPALIDKTSKTASRFIRTF